MEFISKPETQAAQTNLRRELPSQLKKRRSIHDSSVEQVQAWGSEYGQLEDEVEESLHKKEHTTFSALGYDDRQEVKQMMRIRAFMHSDKIVLTRAQEWLNETGRNLVIDAIRQQNNQNARRASTTVEGQNNEVDKLSLLETVESTALGFDPHQELESKTIEEIINQAIGKLNEKMKAIFELRSTTDLTLREIGEILDIPLATVKTNYLRSLKILQNFLTAQGVNQYGLVDEDME